MKKSNIKWWVLDSLRLKGNFIIDHKLIDNFCEKYSGNKNHKGTASEIRYNRRLAALSLVKQKRINGVASKDIKEGFIYILSNPAWPNFYKIGYSLDPRDRLKQYQTGCPFSDYKLEGYYFSFSVRDTEKFIHLKLKNFNVKGEWFKLDLKNLKKFILRQESVLS